MTWCAAVVGCELPDAVMGRDAATVVRLCKISGSLEIAKTKKSPRCRRLFCSLTTSAVAFCLGIAFVLGCGTLAVDCYCCCLPWWFGAGGRCSAPLPPDRRFQFPRGQHRPGSIRVLFDHAIQIHFCFRQQLRILTARFNDIRWYQHPGIILRRFFVVAEDRISTWF